MPNGDRLSEAFSTHNHDVTQISSARHYSHPPDSVKFKNEVTIDSIIGIRNVGNNFLDVKTQDYQQLLNLK